MLVEVLAMSEKYLRNDYKEWDSFAVKGIWTPNEALNRLFEEVKLDGAGYRSGTETEKIMGAYRWEWRRTLNRKGLCSRFDSWLLENVTDEERTKSEHALYAASGRSDYSLRNPVWFVGVYRKGGPSTPDFIKLAEDLGFQPKQQRAQLDEHAGYRIAYDALEPYINPEIVAHRHLMSDQTCGGKTYHVTDLGAQFPPLKPRSKDS